MMQKTQFKYLIIALLFSLNVLGAGTFIQGPALIEGFTTTASSAGTLTLTVASETKQIVTGATTHTIVMPDATTLPLGRKFLIINKSSGDVTVNANGGGLLVTVVGGTQAEIHLRAAGSAAGTWDVLESSSGGGGGGTWGSITGTLSAQTDLQSALDLKAPLASPTFTGTIGTPLTASRVLTTDGSGNLSAAATTSTVLGYLDVSSSLTTLLAGKVDESEFAAKGDILVGTGAGTLDNQAVGTNGQNIVADSAATNGIRYKTPLVDNFIKNGDAESTTPIVTYLNSQGVTFTDTGDTVDLNSHGLQNGTVVSFTSITSTTGISTATGYYVVGAATNTFQVSLTSGGSVIALTTNGSGSLVKPRPSTGTGGSPTVTTSISSTAPLADTNSFLLTKASGAKQGQGWSIPFTIPSSMKAKVAQIEMDYIVNSGTFAAGSSTTDGDLIAYIYDVTNGTLIEPSSIKFLSSSTATSDRIVTNFQTSATGTSYNLILHVASASASAWELKVDNVQVKPSQYVYGTLITDWIAYTPTFGAGFGTASGIAFSSRRVGDSLEVYGKWTNGTVAANTASISVGYGGGNANVTIDTAKVSPLTIIGSLQTSLTATTFFTPYPIAPASNATTIGFTFQSSTVGYGAGAALGNQISATGSANSLHFTVPIVGWSSSTQVSDGYDGRLIASRYTSATASCANNTLAQYNTLDYDKTASVTTGASWKFTAPSQGTYVINQMFNTTAAANTVGQYIGYILFKNGSSTSKYVTLHYVNTTSSVSYSAKGSIEVELNAGDYIDLRSSENLTNDPSLDGTAGLNYIEIKKLQAPTTISATEVVAASYTCGSGQTLTATGIIKYDTKLVDTHGAYNTTTGVFTAPASGIYEISFQVLSINATSQMTIAMRKNSSNVIRASALSFFNTGTTIVNNNSIALIHPVQVTLNSGETLDVYNTAALGTGTMYASSVDNWITIKKIK